MTFFANAIGELRAADRAILLTTHNLTEAEVLADRIAIIRSGEIVAEGTIAELTRQLLGEPIWELQLAAPHQAVEVVPLIESLTAIDEYEGRRVRYRCPDPHALNPVLLSRLAEQGLAIVALSEMSRTLEDVYLKIVAEDEAEGEGKAETPSVSPSANIGAFNPRGANQ